MSNPVRNLLDPVGSHTVEHPLRTGAVLLTVAVLVVIGAVTHTLPFIDSVGGYTVTADFAKANDVNTRSPVRVDGVDVGIVTGVSPGPNPRESSKVTMQITTSSVHLHSDASAAIRWRNLLGGTVYIDLNPGSSDAPKLSGPIPASRTSYQVEFDDLTRVYNGNTETRQQQMIAGTTKALSAPRQIGTSIHALPALTTVGSGLKPLGGLDPGDLSKLVANTARTTKALSASVSNLQSLVSGADDTLAATDAQRVKLGEAMQLSPGTLESAEVTGKRLDTTLDRLDPLVTNLEPGVKKIAPMTRTLGPALIQANAVLKESQPLLRNAKPALVSLKAASQTGTPLLSGLQPTLTRLNTNILPWLDEASPIAGMLDYETIGPAFSVLDSAGSGYDSAGYRIRAAVLLSTPVAMLMDAGTVLGGLTGGESTISAACRREATANEQGDCGAITAVLSRIALGAGGTK
jgi:phospholipid/cholesterol/gamma-HCH transport system substrate-binding protein